MKSIIMIFIRIEYPNVPILNLSSIFGNTNLFSVIVLFLLFLNQPLYKLSYRSISPLQFAWISDCRKYFADCICR